MKEQIKNILLSGNESVIKSNRNTQYLPRNCQLYRFAFGMCKKKFKQKFSLKTHVRNRACTKKDFSCLYCDQHFTNHKSVSKHVRKNRCRYVNNYMFTKDKTVLLYESRINDEFDKHILTYGHAHV